MTGRSALSEIESWTATRVRAIAAVVGLALTSFVVLTVWSSGYFRDDYPFFSMARQGGFGQSLTRSVFGSLVPGFQLGNSILASFNPIPRWPAIVLPALLYALALLLVFRLGELLFGCRPVLICLMVIAGLSGVLAISLVWWTAGLNSMPAVVCDLLALDGLARHAATGRSRHLVVSIVAFAVGIAFYDASASFLVVLVLFNALYLVRPRDWRSLGRGFAERWWLWAGYLAPIILNFSWRESHGSQYVLPAAPTLRSALSFIGAGWAQGFVPTSFGVNYANASQGGARALIVVAGQLLFFGFVAYSIYRRRAAIRAWAVFAGGFLAIEIVATIGRGYAGSLDALNTVYWAVQPFMLVLVIGLAFLPLQPTFEPAVVTPTKKKARPAKAQPWAPATVALVIAVTAVFGGLGAAFIWRAPDRSQGAMNRQYLGNLTTSWDLVKAQDPHAFIWNTAVPPYVVTPLFTPYNRVDSTVGLLLPVRVDAPSGAGYLVGLTGELVPASVQVQGRAVLPAPRCVAAQGSARTVTLALGNAVPVGNWFLRLSYTGSSGFIGSIGDEQVSFAKGPGAFVMPDSPPFVMRTITVNMPAGAAVCVTGADIEAPVAR